MCVLKGISAAVLSLGNADECIELRQNIIRTHCRILPVTRVCVTSFPRYSSSVWSYLHRWMVVNFKKNVLKGEGSGKKKKKKKERNDMEIDWNSKQQSYVREENKFTRTCMSYDHGNIFSLFSLDLNVLIAGKNISLQWNIYFFTLHIIPKFRWVLCVCLHAQNVLNLIPQCCCIMKATRLSTSCTFQLS